jgi:hypothetical protein
MWEILSAITDEHGSRVASTGDGSINRDIAEEKLPDWQRQYPTHKFFIQWTPSPDEWNAYD